jgi:hypothetical protein
MITGGTSDGAEIEEARSRLREVEATASARTMMPTRMRRI